jgi:hypothetical protein
MTEDMFRSLLDDIGAKRDDEGVVRLPEDQLLTLYAAHDGVPLSVAKVEVLRLAHGVVRARTAKGESFYIAREDLFAMSVDGGSKTQMGRKAGFLG